VLLPRRHLLATLDHYPYLTPFDPPTARRTA
jgi:hypothetical protein